jgi:hypothetical protein
MHDVLISGAPWITGACAVLATVVVGVTGWRALQQWRRVRVVQQAASALVGVHLDRLDEAILLAGDRTGTIADGGERLARSLAQLRADAGHLQWLLGRVPHERDRLRGAIGDMLLPADDRSREGAGDGA